MPENVLVITVGGSAQPVITAIKEYEPVYVYGVSPLAWGRVSSQMFPSFHRAEYPHSHGEGTNWKVLYQNKLEWSILATERNRNFPVT